MATFSVEIPDEHAPRLIAAMCGLHEYDINAKPDEQPARFANRIVREYLTGQVARWEAAQAAREAQATAARNKITIVDPNSEK